MTEEPYVNNMQCPECGHNSLRYDTRYGLYECTDDDCRAIFNQRDIDRIRGIGVEPKPGPTAEREYAPQPAPPALPFVAKRNILIAIISVVGGSLVTAALLVFVIFPAFYSTLSAPTDFDVEAGNGRNTLSWVVGTGAEGVVVVCDTSNYPASVDDGTVIYTGSATGYVHDDLEFGNKVYYSIWSYRSSGDGKQYSDSFKSGTGTPYWMGLGGETINEYVEYGSGYAVAGADGELIELINNPDAQQLTWFQVRQFLRNDETDEVIYEDDIFVCADFAEMLHNNAEAAGIRCAYVVITFAGEDDGHACNAFNTSDQGMVYVDCTGTEDGSVNADKIVEIAVGEEYEPEAIFPLIGTNWLSMGEVEQFWVVW